MKDAQGSARPRPEVLALFLVLAYTALQLFWYWGTPLGRAPVLDERENIELARQIADGNLPAEPFYRAMLYPAVLALLPAAALPFAASGLGWALHLAGTTLAAAWSGERHRSRAARLLTGLLYGINPVLIHYSQQILDATLSLVLFLAGGWMLEKALRAPRPAVPLALASAAWTCAALARPQLLLLWLALPVVWLLCAPRRSATRPATALVPALLVAAPLWLTLGLIQHRICGEFHLMPTQGAYNLWAANRPGADGRWFDQQIYLRRGEHPVNPARAESLQLYTVETGLPADDFDRVNSHWRRRFLDHVSAHPAEWLGLMARKTYHLLNHAEAYNNKTFAFHRENSSWLRWNPLGWGPLLLLAVLGAWAARQRGAPVLAPALVGLALAAGVVLFFVSARFRLPLAALLCVLAGGGVHGPAAWRAASRRTRVALGATLLALAGLTFGHAYGAGDRRTFLQDHLLVADAADRLGDDATVWREAGAALAYDPARIDALAWRVTSGLNLLAAGSAPAGLASEWENASLAFLERPAALRGQVVTVGAALALHRLGRQTEAHAIWTDIAAQNGPGSDEARAALLLAAPSDASPPPQIATATTPGLFRRLLDPANADARERLFSNPPPGALFSPSHPPSP